ncbi:MAG: hypothetical protein UY87_C0016G0015 [Candidatus Peribacteria bacterium GW2011_GWC2_54_8]|nr:MAG: hypothetical protein UY87_C0016G0015 [Candidatus Peribacteria bacterium GW2011_GWC2_54_8]KKW40939.1 MAG: hypothetical protein UY90_C0067G0005 [Candidatus Peregrinibacteria bacterium GW2011_GWA2_54_9]
MSGPHPTEFDQVCSSALDAFQSGKTLTSDEIVAATTRFPFLLQCVSGRGDPDLPSDEADLRQKAAIADTVIGNIESGIEALRSKLLQSTQNHPPHILSPFNRVQRNAQNPLRNKYRLYLAALEKNLPQYPIPMNAFFYMLAGKNRQRVAASFRDGDRTMFAAENFSSQCPIDGIVACHETVHVAQNDAVQSGITTIARARQYLERLKFLGKRPSVVLNGELPAYTRELQIADGVLQGALRNPGAVTEDEVIASLGAKRPEQQIVTRTLLRLARVFPGFFRHTPDQRYPESFASEVINICRSERYAVYALSSSDFLGDLEEI